MDAILVLNFDKITDKKTKEIESKSKVVKLLFDHYIIINEINY